MKGILSILLLSAAFSASAQLNIVNGGSTPSGTGWSITGNVLTVTGNVSIDADIITQHLTNTGDLEVNVTSPAAAVTVSEAITYAGATTRALTIRAGTDISVNADMTMNGSLSMVGRTINMGASGGTDLISSTNGQISLLATQHITNTTATTITTQGGHVLLASNTDDATDADATTNGCIRLINGLTITTNGGNITLGGGDAAGSGYALGSSAADFYTGIRIDVTASLNSGGGDIVLRGKSYAISTSNTAFGVGFWSVSSGTTINSGSGTVTLDGFSNSSGADLNSSYNSGIFALNALTITSSNTTANAIQLIGKATTNMGQAWGLETEGNLSLIATGDGGGITVSTSQQRSGDNFDAVFRGETNILAKSGPIRLLGGQSGGIANNRLFTGSSIVYIGSKASSAVTSSTSDVLIQYDMYYFTTYPRIATAGTFTWQPTSASFGQGVQTIWFVWNQNSQTMEELIIGKPGNTQNVTHDNALTVAGPISMYGGTVAINANLTSSADGNIFLKGESGGNKDVYITSGYTVSKTGGTGTLTLQADGGAALDGAVTASGTGVLNTVLWSDFDNTNDGGVRVNGTITSNGGDVWLGGSSTTNGSSTWNGITVGDGPSIGASGSNSYAIDLFNNITTNGGDLFVWAGDGLSGNNGIWTDDNGTIINTGSGNVTFIADQVWGNVSIGSPITLISTGIFTFAPHGGSWPATMSWSHGGGTNINLGSYLEYLNINNFASLGGLQLGYYTGMSGLTFTNTSNITISSAVTTSGPINLYGGTITLNNYLSTTSGDISFYSDVPLGGLSSAQTITTTGAFKYIPRSASFSSAITFPITNLTLSNITELQVGKSGNTSGITIGSTASVNGNASFYGGSITVSAALSAAGNILLNGDPGSFLTQNTKGVTVNAAVTTSNNGNITLIGRGGSGTSQQESHGVYITQLVEAGGTGTVTVTGTGGLSSNGVNASNHGVNLDGASAWIRSNGGNVSVTGYGGGANSGSYSQGVALTTNARVSAGGSGTVTIAGTGGVNTAVGLRGVVVVSGSSIFSAGGAISITGYNGTNGSDNSDGFTLDNATIGSSTSGSITITGTAGGGTGSDAISLSSTNTIGGTSYAGSITLQGNNLAVSGTNTVTTTGLVAIEPVSTSFSSALSFPIGNLSITSNGLRLGKSGNTAALTITGAVASSGPVTTYSGAFTTNASATLTATASDLEVNALGNVTLNAALAGSTTTINGQGDVKTIGSLTNLNLSGGSAQNITGTASLTNLTLNKSAGSATISAGPQNLTGVLTLSAGTLAAGGNLVLKSSAAGTARVAHHNPATGNVTGNVMVERWINSASGTRARQWRLLGFPYNAAMALTSISGMSIDFTTNRSMMYFNEAGADATTGSSTTRNAGYVSYTSSAQQVSVGQGVAAWLYGNSGGAASAGTLASDLTITSSGALNEDGNDVSIPLSYTPATGNPGWNLVSNPFASSIAWSGVTRSASVEPTVYRWNPASANWTTLNTETNAVTGGADDIIESGSGFFVRASASGQSITIPQSAKTTVATTLPHFGRAPFRLDISQERVPAGKPKLAGLRLKASGQGNPLPDDIYIDMSRADATPGYDQLYDAESMGRTSGAGLSVKERDGRPCAVQFDVQIREAGKEQRYYPLTVTSPAVGQTLLEIGSEGDWNPMNTVSLIDTKEGKTILMAGGTGSYTFNMTSKKEEGRFILAINHVLADKNTGIPGSQLRLLGNPVTGDRIDLLLAHPTARPLRWELRSIQGAKVAAGQFSLSDGNIQYGLKVPGMRASGLYVLRVELDNGEVQTIKVMRQ